MFKKLENAWIKVGKILLFALLAAICGYMAYMVFVHRRVIAAAIKGEPLPEAGADQSCPRFCKKK